MEKVRIEAGLPATLAARARAFVAEGCAADLDDLLAEALRRFLERDDDHAGHGGCTGRC